MAGEIGKAKSKSLKRARSRVCSVVGCFNNDYQLSKWKEEICEVHHEPHKTCICESPFQLYTFPTKRADVDARLKWKELINRRDGKNKLWTPGKQSRICSHHFHDKKPSACHPFPVLNLGYNSGSNVSRITKPPRRELNYLRKALKSTLVTLSAADQSTSDQITSDQSTSDQSTSDQSTSSSNHINTEIQSDSDINSLEYESSSDENEPPIKISKPYDNNNIPHNMVTFHLPLIFCNILILISTLLSFIGFLSIRNQELKIKISKLDTIIAALYVELKSARALNKNLCRKVNRIIKRKEKNCTCSKPLYESLLKNDKDTLFFTGIESKVLFFKLYDFVRPYVRRRWLGFKTTTTALKRDFRKAPKQMGPSRFLDGRDEFLLCLMRLRLGLLGKDLQHRFNISSALTARIFSSWLRACALTLGKMVFIPDQGTLNVTKPPHFKPVDNLHSIIDGTEIFIETPKDPKNQKQTWSSYKHHNTVKLLVGVSANSSIIYVSKAYGGSISDKRLTNDCGFLDLLDPHTSLMTDKGFNIQEECSARHINLIIPPGKRGQSQMTTREVNKTSYIAKMRIIVEQIIRQLKCFRILSSEVPISMLSHIDDIVTVCSALTNLKKPIYC